MNKIRTDSARSQSGARTTRPIGKANDEISLMMNEHTEENVTRKPLHKRLRALKMAEGRFTSVCSVEKFMLEHENKNTAQKLNEM